MVHVWSINSGERFQGHHGPLVVKLRVLHLVNFTDRTVFQTFFYTLADIVLLFGM